MRWRQPPGGWLGAFTRQGEAAASDAGGERGAEPRGTQGLIRFLTPGSSQMIGSSFQGTSGPDLSFCSL